MDIGYRMKECRLALGLSAEQVAERLNVNPATIYRYEKGDIEKMPSNILKPLADLLCTTPSYLMGWDMSEKPFVLFSDEELHLIDVFRSADPLYRKVALEMLEEHPAPKKEAK